MLGERRLGEGRVVTFVKGVVSTCLDLHCGTIFIMDITVHTSETQKDTSWRLFVLDFVSPSADSAHHNAAAKDSEMAEVWTATGELLERGFTFW